MIERRNFNRQYIENELRKLAAVLRQKTTVFVAGGAAMAFYGLKEATKDIDVIAQSGSDVDSLVSVLRTLGYADPSPALTIDYRQMKASAILENSDGFRWDIFEWVIAGKLSLSKGMIKRSRRLTDNRELQARFLSKEDIFLLKSVTDREGDIEDMGTIAESGIDWNVIAEECELQASRSGVLWEDALCSRLIDLREGRGVASPIEKIICRMADQKLLDLWIVNRVREGINTVKDLVEEGGEPEHVIRRAIARLVQRRVLMVDRSVKPRRFTMRTRKRT